MYFWVLFGLFSILFTFDASACPICTATMAMSLIIGKILHINQFYLGYLISAIIVSSSDWAFYLYDKYICKKFIFKINNLQQNSSTKISSNLIKLLKLKFSLSKYVLLVALYFSNYYGVMKLVQAYNIHNPSLFRGLVFGFVLSFCVIKLANFLSKKGIKIIRFQKTILLFLTFILFALFSKIFLTKTIESQGRNKNHLLMIVTGPSGSGKTTIANMMEKNLHIKRIVTYTTRKPRPGEVNGVDYIFITKEKFQNMINNNEFAEYSNHFNNSYGTARQDLHSDTDSILLTDENGILKISKDENLNYMIIYLNIDKKEMMKRILQRDNGIDRNELKKRLKSCDMIKVLEGKNLKNFHTVNVNNLTAEEVYTEAVNLYFNNKKLLSI